MNYKRFYRISLSVPILVPLLFFLLSLLIGENKLTRLLIVSLGMGGIQYLFFAALMFYLIGRFDSLKKVRILFWCSPPIYIIFATIGWHLVFDVWFHSKPMAQMNADDIFGPLVFFSIFGSLFGYIYCLIIEVFFQIVKANGRTDADPE